MKIGDEITLEGGMRIRRENVAIWSLYALMWWTISHRPAPEDAWPLHNVYNDKTRSETQLLEWLRARCRRHGRRDAGNELAFDD